MTKLLLLTNDSRHHKQFCSSNDVCSETRLLWALNSRIHLLSQLFYLNSDFYKTFQKWPRVPEMYVKCIFCFIILKTQNFPGAQRRSHMSPIPLSIGVNLPDFSRRLAENVHFFNLPAGDDNLPEKWSFSRRNSQMAKILKCLMILVYL